ncbi:glucose 1-dehydrogenase [Trematosphaeria pertusa]|uniref:Glucose 1-dehydrogenase n=1 Tax=Trematosphaeria pertusa TaxID=390896 RepID=A0A6A6IHR4_9PLEO|nr:glucose 1-dehydrogenase [Trematosphaeria pertusa]KAF2249578.1 glucose 1-dehydrogenase [Trematosphaeria pertusa]
MGKKRVLVGYGIDVDAVANHINTTVGGKPNLTNVSRGVFGATRGVERLLGLWEKYSIKASWFIPGHTIETFPEEMAKIRDAGHEIGLHGYTHEFCSDLTRSQLEAILVKTIEIQTNFCGGKPPAGFTSPSWKNHPEQIELLSKLGIKYDHSFMHDDFQPYYVSTGKEQMVTTDYTKHPDEWMVPMTYAEKSDVVEIPANWTLDDWPPFQWDGARPNAHGYVDPYSVERTWKDMFTWCYRAYDTFIFPISIHPQVSGRPHILMMHERLIEWINTHEGVEWKTFAEMAEEFRAGRISGTGK